jgi:hypothetical protein
MPRRMAKNVEKVKGPNRREVDLAQAHAEIAKAQASIEKWRHLGGAIRTSTAILSTAAVVLALAYLFRPFAGRETTINASIVVSISLVATLTLGGAALGKLAQQRATIRRQRDRINALEQALKLLPSGP